jgi:hypothetical protein
MGGDAPASFTDDAGLRWQIGRYQHLERLPDSGARVLSPVEAQKAAGQEPVL